MRRFLEPCDHEIWRMTLKNNRAPLLSIIKLYASFHHHMWIQSGVTVRKRLSWVLTSVTLTFDLWPWPFAWTSLLSLVITPENFMMIRWWEHGEKGVTDGQTDWISHIAAWSQLKMKHLIIDWNGAWDPTISDEMIIRFRKTDVQEFTNLFYRSDCNTYKSQRHEIMMFSNHFEIKKLSHRPNAELPANFKMKYIIILTPNLSGLRLDNMYSDYKTSLLILEQTPGPLFT